MALHFLYYNFVRVHQTLKTSQAMAAGITKRLWEMKDVVEMIEAWEAAAYPRCCLTQPTTEGGRSQTASG